MKPPDPIIIPKVVVWITLVHSNGQFVYFAHIVICVINFLIKGRIKSYQRINRRFGC